QHGPRNRGHTAEVAGNKANHQRHAKNKRRAHDPENAASPVWCYPQITETKKPAGEKTVDYRYANASEDNPLLNIDWHEVAHRWVGCFCSLRCKDRRCTPKRR